ncbi:MAG: RDD family protein [Schumannella sp.]|nr:RDD family protein [Microbacteriaceae bacterium]
MTASDASTWPGERLGLPAEGPRSVARFGRRVAALFIDWGIAWLLAMAFFPVGTLQPDAWATLAIFAIEQVLFLWAVNGSVGHLILRMRVVPVVPGRLGWWRPVVRTLLLCLAVPALIWDRDQRGLHDRLAGTVLVMV